MKADLGLGDTFLRDTSAGRFGQPSNIKGVSVLLASDAADRITGAAIRWMAGIL